MSLHSNATHVPHYMREQRTRTGHLNCPMYFRYRDQAATATDAYNRGNLHRKAEIELGRCHSYGGYGGYGGCGHCGKPTCGNKGGQYGGCGTFLRIAVKDPQKKACILEKRIARHKKCCEKKCFWYGQRNQCRKLAEAQAELDAILMEQYGPTTIETSTDTAMEKLRIKEQVEDKKYKEEQAKLQKTLVVATGIGIFGLLAFAVLR